MNNNGQFVGIGFGAIQAGLFLYEAYRSGNFDRLTVAEVVPEVVEAIRRNGGRYHVNVATPHGIERHEVRGIEILNPTAPRDRSALADAIAGATEIATALPSVRFYGGGEPESVAGLLADGLRRKASDPGLPPAIVYAAENHNHAAEILDEAIRQANGVAASDVQTRYQSLNTVIGKMSGVVTDEKQIAEQELAPLVPGVARGFLVEAFNRILITRIRWPDFRRGITVFEEKPDLLPFEEAKLYGHNATHALIGYLADRQGYRYMSDAKADSGLMGLARAAFLEESGAALCRRHAGVDPLFTEAGYRQYADDLLNRMMNPHLRDAVERIIRDPRRKLGWEDRLVGTMRVALSQGIEPRRFAAGAAAALLLLEAGENRSGDDLLNDIWHEAPARESDRSQIRSLIHAAAGRLRHQPAAPAPRASAAGPLRLHPRATL